VKLPIGVAVLDSLGCVDNPAVPRCAVTASPNGTHPALVFCQARSIAVVLPNDGATAVITLVAVPVAKFSGKADAAE
jgi:hypothetical protein